jgi:hypothetical protein
MQFLRKHLLISIGIGALWGLTLIISCWIFTPSVPAPTSKSLNQTYWIALPPAQVAALYSLKASLAGWFASPQAQAPATITTLRFSEHSQICGKALYMRFWPDSPSRTIVQVEVLLHDHDPGASCDPG